MAECKQWGNKMHALSKNTRVQRNPHKPQNKGIQKYTKNQKKHKWVDSNELQLGCTTSQTLPEASLTWKLFYDWSTVGGGDNNIK